MRFEIPFNEKTLRKKAEISFNLYQKEHFKKYNSVLYLSILCFLLGIWAFYIKDSSIQITFTLGAILIWIFISVRIKFYKCKKSFFKSVNDNIADHQLNNKPSVLEFLEDSFCFSNFKYNLKVKWETFKNYKQIDNFIILELNDTIVANFMIEKTEIGHQNFQEIIAFLESKIKKDGIL